MSLEWDTTFQAMFLGCGIKAAMPGAVAITVYSGTQGTQSDIVANWTAYNSNSTNHIIHYNGGVWTQQPAQGNVLGLSTLPATKVPVRAGNAQWAIVWMTDVTQISIEGVTLPSENFIVVPCSNIAGSGVVRFDDTSFVINETKQIAEATIESGF